MLVDTPRPPDGMTKKLGIAHYTMEELLSLRQEIDGLLPARALKDINLEEELVLQLQRVKELQSNTLNDEGTPANQKAQVMNACASTIDQLIKMQERYWTGERMKQVEGVLIEVMGEMPEEMQQAFFKRYKEALEVVQ